MDLIVFSQIRWHGPYERPQFLVSRFASYRRVFYFEEPVLGLTDKPKLHSKISPEGVHIVVPYLPNTACSNIQADMEFLIAELVFDEQITRFTTLYFNPRAISFTSKLNSEFIHYDSFEIINEKIAEQLINSANLVTTSDSYLYEDMKSKHDEVHLIPGNIDYPHFSQARLSLIAPSDQESIPSPIIGIQGPLDIGIDLDLMESLINVRDDLNFVILDDPGKISRSNVHYLGKKDFYELPQYYAGWDCAFFPFKSNVPAHGLMARTLELLAAGVPVLISSNPQMKQSIQFFNNLIDLELKRKKYSPDWLREVDIYLSSMSWDLTFEKFKILEHLTYAKNQNAIKPIPSHQQYKTNPMSMGIHGPEGLGFKKSGPISTC